MSRRHLVVFVFACLVLCGTLVAVVSAPPARQTPRRTITGGTAVPPVVFQP